MKKILFILAIIGGEVYSFASEPDILVTQAGESIKVYNLDITSGENVYYTLLDSENALLQKILKSDVLIIKKADGQKLEFSIPRGTDNNPPVSRISFHNPNAHVPLTLDALENNFFIEQKKGDEINEFLLVGSTQSVILNMRLISENDKTLSVAKPRKGFKYDKEVIQIPEFVNLNGTIYTVVSIDDNAFKHKEHLKNIILPETLISIGEKAFEECYRLERIIIPESVDFIGRKAFYVCGISAHTFEQIYIPKNVKYIGETAFRRIGNSGQRSFNDFFQGNLTSLPDWITVGNCKDYGLDEKAVEDYERRIGIRK